MSQIYQTFVERVEEELPLYYTTGNSNFFGNYLEGKHEPDLPDLCGEGRGVASLLHYR
jgi:hypothetical protein